MNEPLNPAVIPVEIAEAAINALLRRKLGFLASQANFATRSEAVGQATDVLGAIWPLIIERVRPS